MNTTRPIAEVARSLGLTPKHLSAFGDSKAKVSLDAIADGQRRGKLVVVTGVTPTPAGEGKTTVAIALTQALGMMSENAAVTLREPALGPVFGVKGGGTGGGRSTVEPQDEINVHFTGDAHAVGTANNLLAAMTDNAAQRESVQGLRPEGITWRRVTDVEDRALRHVATGLGGSANGPVRETGFDIVPASEVMAILALAEGHEDLRQRLERITVATRPNGQPVTAGEVGAVGSMMALLNQAILPNLVQTAEGQPAFVHTGPFGNIAHGCSSVVADRVALAYADYVVTEAGFGADLGLEKFVHIKARAAGLHPSAVVLVATVRALRWHGGSPASALEQPDPLAVRIGASNLAHLVGMARGFGLPVVVAVNRFPSDTVEELVIAQDVAISAGASAAVTCNGFEEGAAGARDLADAVMRVTSGPAPELRYLYDLGAPLMEKVNALATNVYGAARVRWTARAARKLDELEDLGLGTLPICMAKTSASISHDPALRNRPSDYEFEVTDMRASTGAGFVYPLAGAISTMPGLPSRPRSLDVGADGRISGL